MAKAKKTEAGTWRVLIYVGKEDGKRRYKSFTAPTKREAELAALEYKRPRVDMTLREAYYQYVKDRSSLSPSTLREYIRIAEKSRSPLMEMKISEIEEADVKKELSRMRLSPKTIRNRFGLFSAVMREYLPEASFRPKLPKTKKTEVYIPDEDEITRLYNLLKVEEHWLLVAFLLASQCGMRASEIAGLKYKSIDYEKKRIHVVEALVYGKGGCYRKEPKSDAGKREIPVSQEVLDEIGVGDPEERVVARYAPWISTAWSRFIRKTGEKEFSFHKLRHYFCSRALLAGVPKKYVAYYMGHSGEDMVNRVYEHTFPSAREKFADLITKTSLFPQNATANATEKKENP